MPMIIVFQINTMNEDAHDKGKLVETRGRKAAGLREKASYGGWVANRGPIDAFINYIKECAP